MNENSGEALGFRVGRCTVGTLTSPLYLPINVVAGGFDGFASGSNLWNAIIGLGTGLFVGASGGMVQAARHFVGLGSVETKQGDGTTVVEAKRCWDPGAETFEKLAVTR